MLQFKITKNLQPPSSDNQFCSLKHTHKVLNIFIGTPTTKTFTFTTLTNAHICALLICRSPMHPEPIYAGVVRISIISQNVQLNVPEHSWGADSECLVSFSPQLVRKAPQKLLVVTIGFDQTLKFKHDRNSSKNQTLQVSKQVRFRTFT